MPVFVEGAPTIDATDPNNLSNRVLAEREARKRLLTHARMNGNEKDMLILFAKIDKMMRNCPNEKERLDIAKMGVVQAWTLLGGGGDLVIEGEIVATDK